MMVNLGVVGFGLGVGGWVLWVVGWGFMDLGLDGSGFDEHRGIALVYAICLKVFGGDGAGGQNTVREGSEARTHQCFCSNPNPVFEDDGFGNEFKSR